MRWVVRGAVSVLAGLVAAPATAATSRETFIAMHHCAVLARLTRIHERDPRTTSRDRFLVVSRRDDPQRYVQCLFMPGDEALFCEASSGAYRYRREDGVRLMFGLETMTALEGLGFALPDVDANYRKDVALGAPPRLGDAATLILATLHDAYQARPDTPLDFEAPKAAGAGADCAPTS